MGLALSTATAFALVLAIPALMAACVTGSSSGGPSPAESYRAVVPLGLDLVAPTPENNAPTAAKVALGGQLFFDPELSADRSMSCATCHQPALHFTDGRESPLGVPEREGLRNVPSLLNAAYGRSFFWDGRATSLEIQVLEPIRGEDELALGLDELVRRLGARQDYREGFRVAFGDPAVTSERVARALASYVRSLRSGDAPVDRFLHGDTTALSAQAKRGFRLFVGRANCAVCHLAPLFTDHQFHNTGVSWGSSDVGRFAVTARGADRGAFKTPSLRNVAMTAPYMHDGSLAALADVIEHYDRGGTPNAHLDEEIVPLGLTPNEKRQLVSFLESLTGRAEAR